MSQPGLFTYDDSNRAFLQAFLARNVLTLETAKPILAAILSVRSGRDVPPQDITIDDLSEYITTANRALSPLDLEIRSNFHQQTRERCYALVNTTSDPLMQLATTYTPDEIAYVKKLLDAMFDGANNRGKREAMCLSGIEAVQVGRANRRETQDGTSPAANQGLTVREAEGMLGRLLDEGWLEKSRAGFYSLSPRALMELKGWLVETYNDNGDDEEDGPQTQKVKNCHACKEIITVGQRCASQQCPCRLHAICTQNFFRIQRHQNCPLCGTAWDGKNYVGEKAITTSDRYQAARRQSNRSAMDNRAEDSD